jgi:hypothetical protein
MKKLQEKPHDNAGAPVVENADDPEGHRANKEKERTGSCRVSLASTISVTS